MRHSPLVTGLRSHTPGPPQNTSQPILEMEEGYLSHSLCLTVSQDECRAPLIPNPSNLLELTMKMMETRLVK